MRLRIHEACLRRLQTAAQCAYRSGGREGGLCGRT